MKPTQSDTDSPKLVATFTVDGEPVSKSRARFTKRGSKTFAYTPEKTKAGEERVAWTYRSVAKGAPTDPEIAYRVEAHFFNGTRQRRDVDNMVKLILDGLNKVAWVDDNQVTQIEARKSYVTKAEARTEVRVYEVGRLEPPKQPCIRCGAEFRTYESWASNPAGKKYCSTECCNAHRVERRERTCQRCGKKYHHRGPEAPSRFCSRECHYESGRADFVCATCDTPFRDQKNLSRRKNVFCSDGCVESFHAERNRVCPRGHLWADNEAHRKNGARYCAECARLSAAAWHGRKKTKGATEGQPDKADPRLVLTIEEMPNEL